MALSRYISSSTSVNTAGKTEFDILKSSHKFLRDDNDGVDGTGQSWDDRLAQKYYDSLYREFAVCDLKHYKSGNFALRWRTEAEVLSGAGESSCGNTRCEHHHPVPQGVSDRPALTTLELPFAYTEQAVHKSALVKVVLCTRCCKKLLWKRQKNKAEEEKEGKEGDGEMENEMNIDRIHNRAEMDLVREEGKMRRGTRGGGGGDQDEQREGNQNRGDPFRRRMRSSRSRSPPTRRESEDLHSRHRSYKIRQL